MERMLTVDQVAERLGVHRRTIERMVAEGTLPPPLRLSQRILRWEESAVTKWLQAQRARMAQQ